ncbi:hypothetical protein [Aeromonas schubertii]|uniref:hypothetical protein n=1 Tax=Aeromonas schubertii TaxID=652 RepID=UPI001CC5470C|nr:hypothetical protein [Aeromonas schubertii]MBZ6071281.1 hypothetical protein [Aeromonas schubertii]
MESLSQSARAQLNQQLGTLQHQQMPATFTLGAKGNNSFSHTYTVTISQGADAQYHADVSRNYLFGKGSSDGKTSRALATYIQSRLPQPQRQQPPAPPSLQQVQPPQPNPQSQRQQTFDQIFPPLPPRSDDEDRALRDARYQRDKHQAAFVAIQPGPPIANPDEKAIAEAIAKAVNRLTLGFVQSDYHREGTKQLGILLGNLSRQGYDISNHALQDAVFGVHAAYHSAGYDSINSVYQTLLK